MNRREAIGIRFTRPKLRRIGLVAALVGLGIPEYEAKAYEERIKKGGYLMAVHVDDSKKGDSIRNVRKITPKT